jgi:hypothetical protein
MPIAENLAFQDRERIRLEFFGRYRGVEGFSSVSVRRHPQSREWCVYVGGSPDMKLPPSFEGLPVKSFASRVGVHAVAYPPT